MTGDGRRRPVRSYVLREGRLTGGQRRALVQLWPKFGLALPAASLDWSAVFGRDAPLHFEIGFGDGGALLAMAQQHPECNFVGAEVHRPGVGRLLLQLEANGVGNVKIFCADGVEVLTTVAEQSLAAVYLYFPDPWPKKKHHKRRIVRDDFIQLAADKLTAAGGLHFATDWQPYAEDALERLETSERFVNTAGNGNFAPRPRERPLTKFERRGQKLGHEVLDIVMRKA